MRYTDAIPACERYLASGGDSLDPSERDQIQRDLNIIKKLDARIRRRFDFIAKQHVCVTALAGDGTPLSAPYLVYSPTDTSVQVGGPSVGHAGITLVVVWAEVGEVHGRGVLCLSKWLLRARPYALDHRRP